MIVVIAGGHGKIGLALGRLLVTAGFRGAEGSDKLQASEGAKGNEVRGIIRNPEHAAELEAAGVTPALCDLEADAGELPGIVSGADAVVFAAGAGAGSGDARKGTMDRDGAVKLIEACRSTGVRRYLIVSSMGANDPQLPGDGFAAYLRAKAQADAALAASSLDHTIVRPGALTDDPGTGHVQIGRRLERGSIPRADVAAVLAAMLRAPNTIGASVDLVSGPTAIPAAVAAVAPTAAAG